MDEVFDKIRVEDIVVRIPSGQYSYLEGKIKNPSNLSAVLDLAQKLKEQDAKLRYSCTHLLGHKETGKTKAGDRWIRETCVSCGAIRWENHGKFGSWQYPVK